MNIFLIDFENVNSSGLNGINRLDSRDQVIIFYSENADSMTFDLHEQINTSKAYIFFQKVDVGVKNALDFQLATYLGYLICENEKNHKEVYYYLVSKDRGYASLVTYWAKRGIDISLVGGLTEDRSFSDGEADEGFDGMETGKSHAQEPSEKKKRKNKGSSKTGEHKKSKDGGKEQAKESEPQDSDRAGEDKKPRSGKKSRKKKDESPEQKQLRIQVEQAVPDKSVTDLVVSYIQKYKTKLGINNALAKEFKDSKKASEIYKSIKPLIADKKGQ